MFISVTTQFTTGAFPCGELSSYLLKDFSKSFLKIVSLFIGKYYL